MFKFYDDNCPICGEPIYGYKQDRIQSNNRIPMQYCSEKCENVNKMLENTNEHLDKISKLPEKERLEALKKTIDTNGCLRSFIQPIMNMWRDNDERS